MDTEAVNAPGESDDLILLKLVKALTFVEKKETWSLWVYDFMKKKWKLFGFKIYWGEKDLVQL